MSQKSSTSQLDRRTFLKYSSLGLLSLAAACNTSSSPKPTEPPIIDPNEPNDLLHPNVLFIAVDDLNTWLYSKAGYPKPITPNFDRLLAKSLQFQQAYCPAPYCNPSRSAVMTGITPAKSGVYPNEFPFRESPMLADSVTIPQHFAANHYKVMGAGKIFHKPDEASWGDYFYDYFGPYPDESLVPLSGMTETDTYFDWGQLDIDKGDMGDWRSALWVSEQLTKTYEQPFFLGYGINKPHLPWYAPKEYFDLYPLESIEIPVMNPDDLDDLPSMGKVIARPQDDHAMILKYGKWKEAIQAYLACTTFFDDCLGKVLDALEASPHKDTTMIVLWSDHGWHLGEKEHWRKSTLWEEACQIPMLLSMPGQSLAKTSEAVVSSLDLYPTLVELCHLSSKADLDGSSLVPLIRDPKTTWEKPVITTHDYNQHALRLGKWRYIRYANGQEELYDRDADPREWTNLASLPAYASVLADLKQYLPKVNVKL